ncbi:Transcription initiation factor TFIID subunit 4b [Linum grandiflorum]
MDPSIMKLLEEDEDETMHSGADVEAFQAALNRDIEGDKNSTSQTHDSGNQGSSQPFQSWPSIGEDGIPAGASNQGLHNLSHTQHLSHQHQQSSMVHSSLAENHQQLNDMSQGQNHVSTIHQNQSQDDQQGKVEQPPTQAPRTTDIQMSDKSSAPISEPGKSQNSSAESQYLKYSKMPQQMTGTEQAMNSNNQGKQIPFVLLLPALKPHLDKDREMQLQTIFNKLKRNEIPKDQFVRHLRTIVGDQVLKLAVAQWQSQHGTNQSQLQSQALARPQNARMPISSNPSQLPDAHPFALQTGSSSSTDTAYNAHPSVKLQADSSNHALTGTMNPKTRQVDSHAVNFSQMTSANASIVNQDRDSSSIPTQGHNKQNQQHLHFPQTSFPMYGGTGSNFPAYSGTAKNASGTSMKQQPPEMQMRQISHHQSMGINQVGTPSQAMSTLNVPKLERQGSVTDANRLYSGPMPPYPNKPALQQNQVPWQTSTNKDQSRSPFAPMNSVKQEVVEQAGEQSQKSQFGNHHELSVGTEQGNAISGSFKDDSDKYPSNVGFSTASDTAASNSVAPSNTTQMDHNTQIGPRVPSSSAALNTRTPPKKPSVGQKKPLEALGSSPPAASKKQKVSGAFLDQSIEQLNDVTAVSGVNIREEEEQLFSATKEDSRVSEASRRVVQEEEERLLLQKTPLQKKVAEIMAKCGLKNVSSDVEKCLSLSVEERMRSLISNMVRMSKQRIDSEKSRHRTVVTSDVRQQLMTMNQEAKSEWEKKQAEAERLRRVNEPDADGGSEADREKDDGRGKATKVNKEEDDKMRTTAANVAARAAVGGDDMLSKWQLMAEQARQKREGGPDTASSSQSASDGSHKPQTLAGRNNNQDGQKNPDSASLGGRKFGRNNGAVAELREDRTLSIKDAIAVMEREPQLSKSTLIYKLYEKMRSNVAPE